MTSNTNGKKAGWTTNSMDDLSFMASQGSQKFNTMELLGMEKKCMTSSLTLVLHIQHQFQQNTVTLGASLSPMRGLYLISMIHYNLLSLLFPQFRKGKPEDVNI